MYVVPKKFRGQFIVTTRSGRTLMVGDNIEAVESYGLAGRDRTIWKWFEGRYIAKN
jgi:hypothetical protein